MKVNRSIQKSVRFPMKADGWKNMVVIVRAGRAVSRPQAVLAANARAAGAPRSPS